MKKFTSVFCLLALLATSYTVSAQDSTKTFTLSGSIDTYAHTTFGARNVDYGTYGPTTSFANLKGFALGMVNLVASYSGEKAGFTADLVFGPRGSDAVFASGGYRNLVDAGSAQIINQMYAFYKVSDAVTFNLGQFNTFVGYEVISPAINANYSTSYLFSNGPFNHTGLRVDFAFGEGMVAKLAVMNPTDILEFNPVNTYTLGAQIGKTTDAGGVWLNFIMGDQDGKLDEDIDGIGDESSYGTLTQLDLTTGWTLSDLFYLGANVSWQSIGEGEVFDVDGITGNGRETSSFFGVAVYPKLTFSETFALAIRGEMFSAKKFHPLASPFVTDIDGDGSVFATTVTGNIKAGGLTIMPEIRLDTTSEDSFVTKDGDSSDSITSFTLAAVYKF
jgi:spore coat protein U-like protein